MHALRRSSARRRCGSIVRQREFDFRERFCAAMSMRIGTKTRYRIIGTTINQPRAHPREARSIELFDYVGQEQDIARCKFQRVCNIAITVWIALAADFGIEMA